MINFNEFGVMIDNSRNGVMTVSENKRFIDYMAKMGYTYLMLYTEDTFTLENYPYFGYLRGKYTIQEIKEIENYANSKNIELIPCIQTLAHLKCALRWKPFSEHVDCGDILLVDDDETYKIIDDIFATLAKTYKTRKIHIGMDEAHFMGLGRYLDLHGYHNRFDLFCKHLKKVASIADKYGFTTMIWSDMFFKLVNNGQYYCDDLNVTDEHRALIPKNVKLVYWDYLMTDKAHYIKMIKNNNKFGNGTIYGGCGGLSYTGFAPANEHTLKSAKASAEACIEQNVKHVLLTLWGDDGRPCSPFACLPTLYAYSEFNKNNFDMEKIKQGFYSMTGIPFDDFMVLDLPNKIDDNPAMYYNPNKYMLFNDLFLGMYDSFVVPEGKATYTKSSEILKQHFDDENFGYLFKLEQSLCDVLKIKYDLGVETRKAYKAKDKKQLLTLAKKNYSRLIKYLNVFYENFKEYWLKECKPFGLEVHEQRFGGLILRTKSCKQRIIDYCKGKINKIEELEEVILDYLGTGENMSKEQIKAHNWSGMVTPSYF